MQTRVRFAPSPTGTLTVGNALGAVANRRFGDWMLLRIDDTDPARNVPGGEEGIVRDLEWLGVTWDEGPLRTSERAERHREAAAELPQLFDGVMLWRDDGSPTYHLASVIDDIEFGITHVVRGNDHRPNEQLHRRLHEALGTQPRSTSTTGSSSARTERSCPSGPRGRRSRRCARPASRPRLCAPTSRSSACRGTMCSYDLGRIRRLSVDTIAALPDAELAARVGAPLELVPALRGARDLDEARETVRVILEPQPAQLAEEARPTLERFRELRERANGALDHDVARALLRELKAVGGDLRALRVALTGRDRGPELAAVVAALDRDETLRRIDAAL